MNEIALRSFYRMLSIAVVIAALAPNAAWAVRASLIMSADSGDVLSRHAPQRLNAPASLTKLMTAYVVLEAIEDGTLAPDASIAISKHAAARPPTRLGVQAGQKIDVQTALRALIVRSANDIAVALAEHIAGSEEAFVALMNQRAASLGLTATRFRNASGLPAPDQVTTAYDMALLAQALLKRFPDAQDLLSAKEVTWAKRQLTRSHPLLRSEPVVVLKTGFTCMAGFNLVSIIDRPSARLVSVVLGAATPSLRDARARADLRTAFADPGIRADLDDPNVDRSLNEKMLATQCINGPSPRRYMQASKWSVELSLALNPKASIQHARNLIRQHKVSRGRPWVIPMLARTIAYRAGVTALSQGDAVKLCRKIRQDKAHCIVRPPQVSKAIARRGQQALAHAKARGIEGP